METVGRIRSYNEVPWNIFLFSPIYVQSRRPVIREQKFHQHTKYVPPTYTAPIVVSKPRR